MMLRRAALISALAALGLLGWAGYLAFSPDPGRPAAVYVEEPDRDLGDVPLGRVTVTFRVRNPSPRPVELMSGQGLCGAACFAFKGPDRRPIDPGGSEELVIDLYLGQPGPFEFKGDVFLIDDTGLRLGPLAIRGTAVPAGGKANAPPKD